jgi:hypothetical protein
MQVRAVSDETLRGRLSDSSPSVVYRFDGIADTLMLRDEADDESLVLSFGEQIKLLALLIKEHTDLAEAMVKEVRKLPAKCDRAGYHRAVRGGPLVCKGCGAEWNEPHR